MTTTLGATHISVSSGQLTVSSPPDSQTLR